MGTELAIYDAIGGEARVFARSAAERIAGIQRRVVSDIVEIGRELIAVKEAVGHGNFIPWLKAEFDWSERTAQNYIATAERFGAKPQCVSHLPLATVYKLAAPSTPDPVRESIVSRIEGGEVVQAWEVEDRLKQAKREADEARRKAQRASRRGKMSQEDLAKELAKERAREREIERGRQFRAAREANLREASAMIVSALGPDATRRVIELLTTDPKYMDLTLGVRELTAALAE